MNGIRYLLDTNIVSDLVRHPDGRVMQRIAAVGVEQIGISIIVACEVRFGATKNGSPRLAQQVNLVLSQIAIFSRTFALSVRPEPVEGHSPVTNGVRPAHPKRFLNPKR